MVTAAKPLRAGQNVIESICVFGCGVGLPADNRIGRPQFAADGLLHGFANIHRGQDPIGLTGVRLKGLVFPYVVDALESNLVGMLPAEPIPGAVGVAGFLSRLVVGLILG